MRFQSRIENQAETIGYRESFAALCECLDVFVLCKRGATDPASAAEPLRQRLSKHMTLHQLAYGTRLVRPKHHWNFDIPNQLARDRCLLDAFITERIHLQVKWIAEKMRNTTAFELSVLWGVTNEAFSRAAAASPIVGGLRGRTAGLPGAPHISVADRMEYCGLKVSSKDVVFRGDQCGSVVACICEGLDLFAVADVWACRAAVSKNSATWSPAGARELWPAQQLELATAWYPAGIAGSWVVLRM